MGTVKPQSNGPSYSNTVIGTLAVDVWAVTFGTARRGLDGLRSYEADVSFGDLAATSFSTHFLVCAGSA